MATWRVERFGCFGKLPVSREFLLDGGRDLTDSRFDRWIGEGLGLAKAHLGPRFDPLIDSFPLIRFFWTSPAGGKSLIGVFGPSQDAAGRRHPFAVFALAEGKPDGQVPSSAALKADVLQTAAESLWQACRVLTTPQGVLDTIRSTAPPSPAAVPAADYGRYLSRTLGDDFWSALGGEADGNLRHRVLQGLIDLLAPMRKKDGRDLRGGIRLPLPLAEGNPRAGPASFWLDWIELCLARPLERTWWFRSDQGTRPALHVFFTEPSGMHWSGLVDPAMEMESIRELDRPYEDPTLLQRMNPALLALLDSRASTLDEYLRLAAATKGGLS